MAATDCEALGRSSQSFKSTKPMPAFCPPPLKLNPATVKIEATDLASFPGNNH